MVKETVVFALTSSTDLAASICKHLGLPLGKIKVEHFADGEILVEPQESVRGRSVFIIQSTCNPVSERLMEVLICIDACKRASAGEINVIMPYYGYARQDRKAKPRQPITSKLVANLLQVAGAHRVVTFDLHAAQIQGYFDIPIDDITAVPMLASYFKELEIPKEELLLSDKIKSTLEDYKILFDNKNIKLFINIEENIIVHANEALIMRMIDNLLSNALKYAETEVTVCLARRNRIILEVADDGIGISDNEKKHIWDRFYKVDKSRTTTEDNSSGLGLSITKKIVELHDGKIAVLDNKPKGTRFVVNL